MVQAGGRAVKHHPEPDQRLALGVLLGVHVAVVFRFQGRIARIERVDERLLRQWCVRRGQGPGPPQIQLVQGIAHHDAAVLNVAAGEFLVQLLDPIQELVLRSRQWLQVAIFKTRHGKPRLSASCRNIHHITLAMTCWTENDVFAELDSAGERPDSRRLG